MKAISVRQPWADLIISGSKTIEIRKLRTKYRGTLLIHAARIRGTHEFVRAKVDVKSIDDYPQQAIIGLVTLVDVIPLNEKLWTELKEKHLLPGKWSSFEHKYAWIIENPVRLKPIPFIGYPAIYTVNPNIEDVVKEQLKFEQGDWKIDA